ncbi:8-amino-7-oxononanoate synthase [Desulfomonile tiedjei]|uniref:8-amino-7-oxononanoate synthase n=1 Tax=Desulfomonile tiedjei (strain ATCC 49306 / DSM 6799 / DCB-1) TaxID=706587 RepID=I4C8E1_DESTA|nr:8-amino-7-oxononanoate synthase [Desulfomonile tiedjei]AFM25832.1 8-amino-7-oxononanoate synthase [Desulfomonile tiedjei DSM 6799]
MVSLRADSSPWTSDIRDLKQRNLYRLMPDVSGIPGRIIHVNGREALNFSSNNYLGLAGHPKIIEATVRSVREFGAGSTASRLIAGNTEIHRELERFIAEWKGVEAAVLFGSGYQANVGVISCLMGPDDLIVSDELNHASIIDGCRLAKSRVIVYPHFDLNSIEDALRLPGFRRKLVVTESVFSMDGDRAPLREIDSLCRKWGASLMVDEAHASGVLGPCGQGLASEMGVVPEIQMGTLGKAAGTGGAYVAGSRSLIELIVNRARSLIYTTAAPPATIGAALEALKIVISPEGDKRRARLAHNSEVFNGLLCQEFSLDTPPSHIVPVMIGDSGRTMSISTACMDGGIFAHGIRFPTVPEGTARLRFTLMSDHTDADLKKAVDILKTAFENSRSDPKCAASAIDHVQVST